MTNELWLAFLALMLALTLSYRPAPLFRRLLCAVLVVVHVLTASGVPLTLAAPSHDARAFPCQGHQCGCATAEQCWNHCCCHSPAERLAWAKAHQVTPPESLLRQVAAQSTSPAKPKCCCGHHAATAQACSPAEKEPDSAPGEKLQPPRCYGVATLWLTMGAVTAPPVELGWQINLQVVGEASTWQSQLTSLDRLPAVPPPRLAA